MIKLYKYEITLKHDDGIIKINAIAENKKEAIDRVCYAENAPLCSVIECKKIKKLVY